MRSGIYYILIYFIITIFINVNADLIFNHDADWMRYIDDNTKINEINIPGTHDTGTYNIDHYIYNSNFPFLTTVLPDNIKDLTGKTQDLNIEEQLESGIRYLDIRLGLNGKSNKLYVTHGSLACLEEDEYENYTYLYFENIIKYCINFLRKYGSETIIIHLKKEDINIKEKQESLINEKISDLIEEIYNKFDSKENIHYKNYIYVSKENDNDYSNENMPILDNVRGKIVFFSRADFKYRNNNPIGFLRNLDTDEGEKRENCVCPIFGICDIINDDVCAPIEINNFRYQDNFKLTEEDKWSNVLKVLTDKNSKFNKESKDTHTLNFLSIAFTSNWLYSLFRTSG
ncbi:PLC-like phosphodiesterase [Neocallimastix lanati (nom. inval.)]|nr:PLC-like phosphodiesterase [Neocallimastix sp. JGI-2020a]